MVEEFFECECRWEWQCRGVMCSQGFNVWKCNSCHRFAEETYNCVVEVTETVVKAVDACIQDVIDEVLSKVPAEVKKFLDVIQGCTSIDGCRSQREGSLEALGRLVGNWLDENLQSAFSDAFSELQILETTGQNLVGGLETMRGKVENTARSVGTMVEGGLQIAESIINEYGAIDNFCAPASESIPDSVAITDCGAFNQLEKLFKEPWQIEHNFNEVVKKLKECVERKYQGKIPSPFVSLTSSPTCVPDVLQLPMKGLLAAVRYALAQAPGAASGLAAGIMDLVDNVKSIVNRLKALVMEHVSFLQGEAYSSAEGSANFPVIVITTLVPLWASS